MQVIARTPLLELCWLPDVAAGYGIWTGLPRPFDVSRGLELASVLLASKKSTRWISNTEEALVSPPESQELITGWLRRMHDTGRLTVWADIPPRSAIARLVVKNLGLESNLCGVRFAQFGALDDAKTWVTR